MNINKLLYYLNKLKWYFVIIIPMIILIFMSIQGKTSENITNTVNFLFVFVKLNWIWVIIISFIVAILLWFLMFLRSKQSLSRLTKQHEELREKSEVKKLKQSIHRE
jgi:membrane protein insertase Oxa1/YidC/SpoIIIJ